MMVAKACVTAFFLSGTMVFADNAQSDLARQIEAASTTSNLADFEADADHAQARGSAPIYRREMSVAGCDVTVRGVQINPHNATEELVFKLPFDLGRTQFPEPTVPVGPEFVFVMTDSDKPSADAAFRLTFVPPYRAVSWSEIAGEGTEIPFKSAMYFMSPVSGEDQPRRLLALLKQYQAQYCRP